MSIQINSPEEKEKKQPAEITSYIKAVENKITELKEKGNSYFLNYDIGKQISEYVEKMKDKKEKLVNRINKYARGPSPTLLYKPDEIELINDAFDKLDNYVNERENKALASEKIEDVTKDPGHNQSQEDMYESGRSDFHSNWMVALAAASKGGKRKSRRKRKLKKRKTMKKKRLKRKKTMKKRKSRKRRKTKKRSKRR